MKKTISILGSTGSVGQTSLEILNKKKNFFDINLLYANKNFKLICHQIKKYNPKIFVINDLKILEKVKKKFKNKKTIITNFIKKKNIIKSDITISAIPGIAGLNPTLMMIKYSKKILIANKESVICGWNLISKEAIKFGVKIIPIDSEHFSIMKLIENTKLNDVKKIYLTASGGPFLNYKVSQLKKIKPKDAIKHPKWKMGKKISVDSASLMNKILELLEANKLFNIPQNKLEILIHPNSLVHAIVVLKNGLTKFIYHETSMVVPIANAIFEDQLNIEDFYVLKKNKKKIIIENLFFYKADKKNYPMIKLKDKIFQFPSSPIIINAANEVLVDHFLRKKIAFLSIYKIILGILRDRNYKKYAIRKPNKINQIKDIDNWSRKKTLEIINSKNDQIN